MDPMPPGPPGGEPPFGPNGPPDPFATTSSPNRAPLIVVGALVLGVLAVLAAVVLLLSGTGDDGGDDDAGSSEAAASAGGEDDEDDEGDEDDGEASETTVEPTDETPATAPPTTKPPATTVPEALDLLRNDPRPAVDAFVDTAGDGAMAVEVVLYLDYAFADVRQGARIVEHAWRDGEVDVGEPEAPFPGTDLDAEQFRLSRVSWDALPRLVRNAPRRAGIPRGEVTHVIVGSDLPFSPRFIFRIYVRDEQSGASDYVVATIDGRPADR